VLAEVRRTAQITKEVAMEKWDLFLELLQASLKKNGNKEITIQHLINMMKMVDKQTEEIDSRDYDAYDALDWEWK